MTRIVSAMLGLAVLASSLVAAQASGRHVRGAEAVASAHRGTDYYPGWGRERVTIYGVPPGLVYGGAISAPAGR